MHNPNPDLSTYSDAQLRASVQLLRTDSEFSHLAHLCELELIRRKSPPIEDIFPEGDYVREGAHGEEFIPLKG